MNAQQERAVVEGLRALAAATKDAGASPQVERAVLAALEGRLKPAPTHDSPGPTHDSPGPTHDSPGPTHDSRPGAGPAAVGAGFSRPSGVEAALPGPSTVGGSRPTRPAGGFVYATAAALLLVSLSGAWLARESTQQRPGPIHPAGFVEIPNAWTLPPMESGTIVRVALPVTILPQYGLAILPDVANHMVDAELLIAQDGLPRMIRLAHDDSTRSTP